MRLPLRSLRPLLVALPLALVACHSLGESSMASGPTSVAAPRVPVDASGEKHEKLPENDWVDTAKLATSTFAVDVDTASYSLMRRDVTAGRLPAAAGVRPEEYVNYFAYDYPEPEGARPFSVTLDAAPSPFGEGLHLVRVGLKGRTIHEAQRKRANLVFLVDVSGSMADGDKLPLVQYALKQLVRRLEPADTLALVTYAGLERVLLEPTPVSNKAPILDAIDGLTASGGTHGEGGIRKAYDLAERAKLEGSINRVVLCTDGDFNIGATGDELHALIEVERERGVTLTALGFGQGNYNDATMQNLADRGNGNYAYIDTAGEANRVLGEKLVSTLQVIAKDVKVQVAFDPAEVKRYRLIGYENRVMANEDFVDDKKDAGEIGAGHSVTAFYEVELARSGSAAAQGGKLADVRLRSKAPDGDVSSEIATTLEGKALAQTFDAAPADFRFAAAVTELAEILRRSKHSKGARFDEVIAIAEGATSERADRKELVTLATSAKRLWK